MDCSAEGSNIHLLKEVSEGRIRDGGRRNSNLRALVSTLWWRVTNRSRIRGSGSG
jgi:hypothetical protein